MKKMNRTLGSIFSLLLGFTTAHAALTVDLFNAGGSADNSASTVFTYGSLEGAPTFTGGLYDAATSNAQNTVSGADGGFTVTWTAATETDASAWDFDTTTAYEIRDFGTGWGLSTLNDATSGSGNFQAGEVFLLGFDLSGLTLDAGSSLMFSFATRDTNDEFEIYQRSAAAGGTNVLSINNLAAYSDPVEVSTLNGYTEFAIAFGGVSGGDLISSFSVDVISSVVDTNAPLPDPAEWDSPPTAGGPFEISMAAVAGSDANGVEYLFEETSGSPGATDSGWQSSPSYSDSGLDPDTTYSYTVTMRDTVGNTGAVSLVESETTTTVGGRTNGPPNVVIIYADDLGYADISFNKSSPASMAHTPSIDRICEEGLFLSGYMTHHVCSPSRGGLLTGRHYTEVGVGQYVGGQLDNSIPNIAKDFQAAGYATACFGKWHNGSKIDVNDYGFDEWAGFYGGAKDYHDRGTSWWSNDTQVTESGYGTYIIGDDALRFVDDHAHEPFFLYVPHQCVHSPYDILNTDLEEMCNIVSSNHPSLAWSSVKALVGSKGATIENVLQMYCSPGKEFDMNALDGTLPGFKQLVYYTMIYAMDKTTGDLLDRLESQGLSTNTIVVFASDNGGVNNRGDNLPFYGHKQQLWEGGIHVAAGIWWPGTLDANQSPYSPGDNVYTNMTQYFDIYPTLMSAAGQTVDPSAELDGLNLYSNLLTRTPVRSGFDNCYYGIDDVWAAVRNDRWKLHFNRLPTGQMLELYDLYNDVSESTNVAGVYTNELITLIGLMDAWYAEGDVSSSYMPVKGEILPAYLEPAPFGDILEITAVQTGTLTDPDSEGVYIEFAKTAWGSGLYEFTHAGDVFQFDIYVAADSDQLSGMFASPDYNLNNIPPSPLFRSVGGIGLDDGMLYNRVLPKGQWIRCVAGVGDASPRAQSETFAALLASGPGTYHYYLDNVLLRKSDGSVRAVAWNSDADTLSTLSYTYGGDEYTLSNLLAQPGIAFSSVSVNAVDLSTLPATPESGSRYTDWADTIGGLDGYDPGEPGPTNSWAVLSEYAIGSDPTTFTEGLLRGTNAPTSQQLGLYTMPSQSNEYMTLTFDFNREANDIELVVAESTNLVDWTESLVLQPPYADTSGLGSSSTVVSVTDNAPGDYSADTTRITARSTFTLDKEPKGFIALKVRSAVTAAEDVPELRADSHEGILLEWTPVEKGEFVLERAAAGSGSFLEITRTENNQYTDPSAVNGQTYDYRVRAVNAAGATDWSNTVPITR